MEQNNVEAKKGARRGPRLLISQARRHPAVCVRSSRAGVIGKEAGESAGMQGLGRPGGFRARALNATACMKAFHMRAGEGYSDGLRGQPLAPDTERTRG
jgi:hypothetical protein